MQGLLRDADRQGDRSPVIPEIIRLGEGYSIVSEYTSFLVLENDAEYRRWALDRRNAVRYAKDRGALDQVRSELAKLRDKAAQNAPVELANLPSEPEQRSVQAQPQPVIPSPSTAPAPLQSAPVHATPRRSFDIGGGGGGGAISPAMVLGFSSAVAFLLIRRRSRSA
jgi:Ca-activated chloride channel homolog